MVPTLSPASVPPPELETEATWGEGLAPPATAETGITAGEMAIVGGDDRALTPRLTRMVSGTTPGRLERTGICAV